MSRFGQIRGGLRKVSELSLSHRSTRNGVFLVKIESENRRHFSALTPILCCKSPDGGGPTPPPTGTSGSGSNSKGKLTCPKCGNPVDGINGYLSKSRFVTCDRCSHLFMVMNETDSKQRIGASADPSAEGQRAGHAASNRKPPPPPKKIKEFLDKHIVGQEVAKKSLSVAVYNHYKRIHHNIPVNKRDSHKYEPETMPNSILPSQKGEF